MYILTKILKTREFQYTINRTFPSESFSVSNDSSLRTELNQIPIYILPPRIPTKPRCDVCIGRFITTRVVKNSGNIFLFYLFIIVVSYAHEFNTLVIFFFFAHGSTKMWQIALKITIIFFINVIT